MTWHARPENERWVELMAGRTLGDLTRQEENQLATLCADAPGDARSFELAATAIHLAVAPPATGPMPAHVQEQILATFRQSRTSSPAPFFGMPQQVEAVPAVGIAVVPMIYKIGWLAAAACFVAAVASWWPRAEAPRPDLYATVDQQLDVIKPAWTFNEAGGADLRFANVTGEVHWSTATQSGYMEFVGLPINDPKKQQYQLWIVDPARDAEPVDGGVFDVTESGHVRIPIGAKLPITSPAAFALTVEKPGGVVVSEGPLHLVAAVKS